MSDYEYGIRHAARPEEAHRWDMTQAQAEAFINEWLADGGRGGAFSIIRRPRNQWEPVPYPVASS